MCRDVGEEKVPRLPGTEHILTVGPGDAGSGKGAGGRENRKKGHLARWEEKEQHK